jgi:CPA1 family monovalent cation:H+ antiporter
MVQLKNFIFGSTLSESSGSSTTSNVTTLVWLLIAVLVVAVLTKYVKLPYTIALVIAGLGIALTPGTIQAIVLTPDLIVIVFLPALLFEAAYNLSYDHLREVFRFIGSLAFFGVLATAGIISGMLIWLGGLPWQTALLFGAIVAATDPISVVAVFRKLGAPRRLTTLVEGESLFNDGSALVLFNLLVGIVVSEKFDAWNSLIEFVKVSVGGLALGVAIGYLALLLLSRFNDHLTEMLVTLVVAYGTFLVAEQLGLSPALAVVAAGLLVGNFAQEKAMSPSTRIAVGQNWEFLGFLANSLIFLLVGLEIRAINLGFSEYWGILALGIAATVLSRIVVVAFFSWLNGLLNRSSAIPLSWQVVLVWGGLRGSLSLALALSLPFTLASGAVFADRDKLLVMTFGLILFTLLVQGLTIEPLVKFLNLGNSSSEEYQKYELSRSQLLIAQAASREVQTMLRQGIYPENCIRQLQTYYREQEEEARRQLHEIHLNSEVLLNEQLKAAQVHLLQVEKDTARNLFRRGVISEETLLQLVRDIDAKILMLEQGSPDQTDDAAKQSALVPSTFAETTNPVPDK